MSFYDDNIYFITFFVFNIEGVFFTFDIHESFIYGHSPVETADFINRTFAVITIFSNDTANPASHNGYLFVEMSEQ